MTRCEDIEVAIEMRLHGALGRAESETVEAHLATCESCRAFQSLARRTENAMTEQAALHVSTLDWEALWSRTRTFVSRQSKQRMFSALVVIAAMTPMVMLQGRDPLRSALTMAVAGAIVVAVMQIAWVRKSRAIASYQKDAGELLFFYRRELEDRLRSTLRSLWLVPASIALIVLQTYSHDPTPRRWAGVAGMAAIMLVATGYVLLVRRPAIRRELDALKSDIARR